MAGSTRGLFSKAMREMEETGDHLNVVDLSESYDRAKATLHENHINNLIMGTADSKLFPVVVDGELKWAVLVEHAYKQS